MRVEKWFAMFFDEELGGESLLIQWTHPGTGFKFIKIFGSVPKYDSRDFPLGFKQWEKLDLGLPLQTEIP